MFKLLKWDFINFSKKFFWTLPVLGFLTLFLNRTYFNEIDCDIWIPNTLRFIYIRHLWILLNIITVTLLSVFSWTGKTNTVLESSVSVPPWKHLLSKTILSFVNCFIYIFFFVMFDLLDNGIFEYGYIVSEIQFYLPKNTDIPIFCAATLLFVIIAKSFVLTRRHPVIPTGFLCLILICIYDPLNEWISHWSYLNPNVVSILFLALFFCAGFLLYKYRFRLT